MFSYTQEHNPEFVLPVLVIIIITLYGYFSLYFDIVYLLVNVSMAIYHWLFPKEDAKVKEDKKTDEKATETIKEEVKPDYKAIKFEEDREAFDKKFYNICNSYIKEVENLKKFKEKAVFANSMYHYIEENLENILKYNLGQKYHAFLGTSCKKIHEFDVDCNIHIIDDYSLVLTMEEYNTVVLARTLKKTMENYKKNIILLYLLKEFCYDYSYDFKYNKKTIE